ncbi:MAG TPA: TetR family transcriptional regulator [bacterium]|nr:TetR family transcriptional regulator [bacterium]HPN31393.1 TetR family transcriptional regulator [bacterium]
MTDLQIFETAGETELKILDAAKKIFSIKGYDGARMQEIANEAKINKAALHYYFRSKDKLFELIFKFCFKKIYNNLGEIIEKDMPLKDKIKFMTENYIDFISKNQYLIPFIMTELAKNPDRFVKVIKESDVKFKSENFINQIKKEAKAGNIKEIDPFQLFMNIISMCVFPFPAKPMLCAILGISELKYKKMMEERKKIIADFIMDSLINPVHRE